MKKSIIIDTDPGIDDSLAISLAIKSPDLQILALTTVFGNSNLINTTANALTIKQLLRTQTPVYPGEARPLSGQAILADSHGNDGLGGFQLKKYNQLNLQNRPSANRYLTEQLSSDRGLNLACLGPTTNVARLINQDKKLANNIAQTVILGGALSVPGNKTEFAEFNVLNDPLALQIILDSDLFPILIPIDVCQKVVFDQADFERLSKIGRLGSRLSQIADIYLSYYQSNQEFGNFSGAVMYDLLVIIYFIKPELFLLRPENIKVTTQPGDNYGQTYIDKRKRSRPNCRLVTDVQDGKIKQLFFKTIKASV